MPVLTLQDGDCVEVMRTLADGSVGAVVCDPPYGLHANITAPATDAARAWDGWGTALKPSWEPVVVGRKPE